MRLHSAGCGFEVETQPRSASEAPGPVARWLGGTLLALAVACGGCAGALNGGPAGGPTATQPADAAAEAWPPLPVPAGFDRERAALPLAQVPGDPPAPAQAGPSAGSDELPRQALRRIEEARRLFAEQRFSETLQELEKALRYNANSAEAHRLMALAGLLSGNEEKASAGAERALTLQPDDLACHYVLGRLAEKSQKPDEALKHYRTALKCPGSEADASYRVLTHYYLGSLLFEQNYLGAAVEQLAAFEAGLRGLGEKLAANPELASVARVHRGTAAIRAARAEGMLGRYPEAADSLKVAAAESPKDLALRAEYIRMLGRARRLEEAAAEAARFVADSGASRESVELLLAVHRAGGHPERAVTAMKDLIATYPDNIELRQLYIDALSAAKRFDEAVAALDELVKRHPDATDSRWRLIQLTRERGAWPAWISALADHVAGQPADDGRVSEELAQVPAAIGERMLRERERGGPRSVLPSEPGDARAAAAMDAVLARLAGRFNQPEQARELYTAAAKRSPGFLPAAIGLAQMHVDACRWQEAIDVLKAAAQDPKQPSARVERLLGQCWDGLDEIEPAVEHFKKAIDLNKNDAGAMLMLARMYDRIGKPNEARPLYQSAIAAEQGNMLAREMFIRHLVNNQSERTMSRVSGELRDMQRLAPDEAATARVAALVNLLTRGQAERPAYLDVLRKLVQNRPDDLRSREDLASSLLAFRQYAAARDESAEILKRRPCSVEAAELHAVAQMRLLDFAAAAEQLKRSLGYYPNRESLLLHLGQVRLIEQDYAGAIAAWQRLSALKSAAARQNNYRASLMAVYREAGRFDEARQLAEKWLAEAGEDKRAVGRIRTYLLAADAAAGDHERYVARCREWLKADPANRELRGWLLGVTYPTGSLVPALRPIGLVALKQYDEIVLLALSWLSEKPDDQEAAGWVVAALQAAGRHNEAIELARAQVSSSTKPEERIIRMVLLREAYTRAKKYEETLATSRELISDGQRVLSELFIYELNRRIATILSQGGRHEEAAAHINKLLEELGQQKQQVRAVIEKETDPQRRQAWQGAMDELGEREAMILRTLSYIYQRAGKRDAAEARLREAHKLDPDEIGINNDLGYILAESDKDLEEAERMTRLAVGEEPRTAAYQDSLAWVLYKKGDLQGARAWLLRAAALEEGQDAVIFDHLGDVQWRLGEKDRAVASWKKSLELYARQAAEGESDVDEKLPERVRAKLEAVAAGAKPAVAHFAAESRPAP